MNGPVDSYIYLSYIYTDSTGLVKTTWDFNYDLILRITWDCVISQTKVLLKIADAIGLYLMIDLTSLTF